MTKRRWLQLAANYAEARWLWTDVAVIEEMADLTVRPDQCIDAAADAYDFMDPSEPWMCDGYDAAAVQQLVNQIADEWSRAC